MTPIGDEMNDKIKVTYHMICDICGKDFWSEDAFPSDLIIICPECDDRIEYWKRRQIGREDK